MASRPKSEAGRPAPRLYLVTPPEESGAGLEHGLAAALDAVDIAAILVRLPGLDEGSMIRQVKAIAPTIQSKGVALLIDGYPEIVARAGADGAHVRGVEAFTEAVTALKPDRIAGCGGLHTRHDAMIVAELETDYVMFGDPDARGDRPTLETIVERISWWAEVFNVPCVGYAGHIDEVATLAAAGADFVAIGSWIWSDPRGAPAGLKDAADRMLAGVGAWS